jgi:antitoxin Phd
MAHTWQLQEAKNRFSEVVDKAVDEGPQIVTRHGVEVVVVISIAHYRKLRGHRGSLVEFFAHSPLRNAKLDLSRDKDTGRSEGFEVPS